MQYIHSERLSFSDIGCQWNDLKVLTSATACKYVAQCCQLSLMLVDLEHALLSMDELIGI
jgi:hypothetical protein